MLMVHRSFAYAVRGTHRADHSGLSDVWMLTDSKSAAVTAAIALDAGSAYSAVEVEDDNQRVVWASYSPSACNWVGGDPECGHCWGSDLCKCGAVRQ